MEANDGTTSNQDDLIMAQKAAIEREIADKTDLVAVKLEPINVLEEEFKNDDRFVEKVKNLGFQYEGLRRTRPDGNCFYRAFGFRLFELLLSNKEKWERFKSAVGSSKAEMGALGFPTFTVEDFYDNFMETLEKLHHHQDDFDLSELLKTFNDQGLSDYLVVFLRLLTSKQLQKDADFYQNFMEGGQSVLEFCNAEVEPMYRESDHIHIIALTAATGINVRILYLDRGSNREASPHDFPEESAPDIHLLYRPGHYDVLYPK